MRVFVLRGVQHVLQWLGIGLLAYVLGVLGYAQIYQAFESRKFDRNRSNSRTDANKPNEDWSWGPVEGDILGRLEIPQLSLSVMVLQGTDEKALASGAGHILESPLPGVPGNIAIAAHRDTFFRDLKNIQLDDEIRLSTLNATYVYSVRATTVVDPEDTQVISSHGKNELTLITCYPFYFIGTAPKRFIVQAVPVRASP
jgi:sortase A